MQALTLRDGTPALIWPLLPTDDKALQENYQRLSARSKYNRFLSSKPTLSAAMLRLLVDQVDARNHTALVLVAFPDDAPEHLAGIGRLIRYTVQPTRADVAVTVADNWQSRGVGSALLAELLRERPAGVDEIVTRVAADNRASLAMLRRLGPTWTGSAGPGVFEVRVQLDPMPVVQGDRPAVEVASGSPAEAETGREHGVTA